MGVQAGEGREQAGVDVQHAALPGGDEERREDPHVACEANELDAVGAQDGVDPAFMGFAVAAEGAMVDGERRDAGAGGGGEAGRVGDVGDDDGDVGRVVRGGGGLDQAAHVAAAAADQDADGDALLGQPGQPAGRSMRMEAGPVQASTWPMG